MAQVTMILSNGRLLLPAVVAVRVLGGDRLELGIAARDEIVVEAAGALRQRLDDLDRPHLVGQVGEIGRLVAGAGADLEHPVAELHVHRIGHARDRVRAGDRHAIADAEVVPFIGAAEIGRRDELLARRQQVGANVALVPDVPGSLELLEAVPTLAEKARVLAAVLRHPGDVVRPLVHRRRRVPIVGDRNIRFRRRGKQAGSHGGGGPGHEMTSGQRGRPVHRQVSPPAADVAAATSYPPWLTCCKSGLSPLRVTRP